MLTRSDHALFPSSRKPLDPSHPPPCLAPLPLQVRARTGDALAAAPYALGRLLEWIRLPPPQPPGVGASASADELSLQLLRQCCTASTSLCEAAALAKAPELLVQVRVRGGGRGVARCRCVHSHLGRAQGGQLGFWGFHTRGAGAPVGFGAEQPALPGGAWPALLTSRLNPQIFPSLVLPSFPPPI
eukprot:360583-Chlamydomonas_euryale.AAC.2